MRKLLLATAVAAVTLTGCATLNAWTNLQSPQVEVAAIRVVSIGLTSGTFDVTLRVNNPNSVTLDGTGLTATIDAKGNRFAQVDLSNAFTLPKGEGISLVVPVLVQWSGATAAVRELIGAGSVPYTIGGRVTVDTPIGARGLDFSTSGTVSVVR